MTTTTPLLTRRAVLQVAMETTYRTEAAVGATDAIYVEDPDYQINLNLLERNFTRDDLSPLPSIVGRRLATMTFTTELKGNGAQQSGVVGNAPIISRLFRASGFAMTGKSAKSITPVYPLGVHANTVTWGANTAVAATHTDVIAYHLECTLAGASGTAKLTVTSDVAGEGNAAAVVTTAVAFPMGTKGLTITPTFTGSLALGQKWVVWLLPTGIKLDPVSDLFESATLVLNMDGVKHKMLGSFGTFSINAEAGDYPKVEWEFQGTFEDPVDAVLPVCTYETTLPVQTELARLRVANYYAIVNAFSYTQGNDIQIRPDVSSAEGYIGTRIVARTPEGGIDPEAELVASHDFWGKMGLAERMAFQMRIGRVIGNQIWIMAPSTQYSGLTYQDRNGIRTYDAQLRFSRVTGNDEISFHFC